MATQGYDGITRRHDLGALAIGTLLALLKLGVVSPTAHPRLHANIVRLVAEWEATFVTAEAEQRVAELHQVELRG